MLFGRNCVLLSLPDAEHAFLGKIGHAACFRAVIVQGQVTVDAAVFQVKADFYDFFTPKNAERPEIHGGFAFAHWSGDSGVEAQIKEDLKVTIRCIPTDPAFKDETPGKCIFTGAPSPRRVLFGKAY